MTTLYHDGDHKRKEPENRPTISGLLPLCVLYMEKIAPVGETILLAILEQIRCTCNSDSMLFSCARIRITRAWPVEVAPS